MEPVEETRGEINCRWLMDFLVVPEGSDVGQPFKLRDWQRKELLRLYDNPAGTRTFICSFPRKNGKSTLCAALLLLHLCGPEARLNRNSQIVSTAMSRDQAAVLYSLAAKMVRMGKLSAVVSCRDSLKELTCPSLGTTYRALSADASTAHGLSPVLHLADELGQVRGPVSELYNAVESGMSAHKRPLSVVLSTQAPTDTDLLSVLIDDALSDKDPRVLVSLYTAPPELDPFSEEALRAANPAYGDTFQNADELRIQAETARRMPAQEPLYRLYNLNQRVEASAPFVSRSVWQANGGAPVDGHVVYGGLDLSEVGDLTALVLVSPSDGKLSVSPHFWLPGEGLAERARRDRTPYDLWHKQGYLSVTPGKAVEYAFIAEYLAGLFREKEVRKIAFDAWNMRHLRPWLVRAGLPESLIDDRFVEFRQGYVSMTPALRTLESLLLSERLAHGMNPILTAHAASAVVQRDEVGNRKFTKKKSSGRIDGMVALAMACAVAYEALNERRIFSVPLSQIVQRASA